MDRSEFELPLEEKIRWMIDTNGWAVEPVSPVPDSDPPVPAYSYSIGLPDAVDFPDVAVFGLTPVAAKGLIDLVAGARQGGTEIPLGVELLGLLDGELRCVLAPIDVARWAPLFATAAEWYQGTAFEMAQLMYPDRSGFMPYEPDYEQRMRFAQPVIGDPPTHAEGSPPGEPPQ